MLPLERCLADFLLRHVPPSAALAVGYSGGIDSTVLLVAAARVLAAERGRLTALHVNHGLSPQAHVWQVAGVMAMCVVVSWKYGLCLFLGLHLVNSYVYLGSSSFWQYVTLTGSRLAPAVKAGRVDFSPAKTSRLLRARGRLARNRADQWSHRAHAPPALAPRDRPAQGLLQRAPT